MEMSRFLPNTYINKWNKRFVANSDGLQYEKLTFTAPAGVVVFGNGTDIVDIQKTAGADNSWNQHAYTAQGWSAPFTAEFVNIFPDNNTDNANSYAMFSLNTDPTTDANYTSLDYAMYPYITGQYQIYNNGTYIEPSKTCTPYSKFYFVYSTNGFLYHYNGSNLLYSVNTGSSTTLRYIDMSIYNLGHGFNRIRGIKKEWNGQAYV